MSKKTIGHDQHDMTDIRSAKARKSTMEAEDITQRIIGSAFRVFNTLGFGFLESVYQKALSIELSKQSFNHETESPLKVYYNGQVVGDFYVDLFVEDQIIVELKSVRVLNKAHEVQLVNYLTATQKNVGLLINFGPEGVEVKRKYRRLQPFSPSAD